MGAARAKLLGAAVLVCCLWALQGYFGVLEFDRQKVLSGEIWRIWTGHLVHTNSVHFSLNIAAALLVFFVFFRNIKLSELLLCSFVFAALISVTLLCTYPGLGWYNGLSGLLHALVTYFSMRLAKDEDKIFLAVLAVVWVKVLVEAVRSHFGYEKLVGGMAVITEAHLVGAFFGTVTAFICMLHWREKGKPERRLEAAQ